MKLTINDLFDLSHSAAADYLRQYTFPWEALAGIGELILTLGEKLPPEEYEHTEENIWIARDAKVYPTAWIGGPCIIGHKTEVRPGAFIRGNALVGDNCVVGNSTELKNVILFDNVQVPHYNYVGDSILGYKAHMGAGSITSNVKSDKINVVIHNQGEEIPTNRKKVGAFLGDRVEIGCNSVLNPGTVIGRDASVYPTSCVRGVVPENCIRKLSGNIIPREFKF
ncbi:MAG: UDP-N-acetylglucosamine pyrophosphorylase [Oscillospiraceae bacterium]|nr:UDP-N-acetylglucosamine pyrophosphorylase [Oscillospiraceae bacterium]